MQQHKILAFKKTKEFQQNVEEVKLFFINIIGFIF